jgi:hypothetical protein
VQIKRIATIVKDFPAALMNAAKTCSTCRSKYFTTLTKKVPGILQKRNPDTIKLRPEALESLRKE